MFKLTLPPFKEQKLPQFNTLGNNEDPLRTKQFNQNQEVIIALFNDHTKLIKYSTEMSRKKTIGNMRHLGLEEVSNLTNDSRNELGESNFLARRCILSFVTA